LNTIKDTDSDDDDFFEREKSIEEAIEPAVNFEAMSAARSINKTLRRSHLASNDGTLLGSRRMIVKARECLPSAMKLQETLNKTKICKIEPLVITK
jgi:hypothetical protein